MPTPLRCNCNYFDQPVGVGIVLPEASLHVVDFATTSAQSALDIDFQNGHFAMRFRRNNVVLADVWRPQGGSLTFDSYKDDGTLGAGFVFNSPTAGVQILGPLSTNGPFIAYTGATVGGTAGLQVNGPLTANGAVQVNGTATFTGGLTSAAGISSGPLTANGITCIWVSGITSFGTIQCGTTAPGSPSDGHLWLSTTDGVSAIRTWEFSVSQGNNRGLVLKDVQSGATPLVVSRDTGLITANNGLSVGGTAGLQVNSPAAFNANVVIGQSGAPSALNVNGGPNVGLTVFDGPISTSKSNPGVHGQGPDIQASGGFRATQYTSYDGNGLPRTDVQARLIADGRGGFYA